jgi:hypothetical protein
MFCLLPSLVDRATVKFLFGREPLDADCHNAYQVKPENHVPVGTLSQNKYIGRNPSNKPEYSNQGHSLDKAKSYTPNTR